MSRSLKKGLFVDYKLAKKVAELKNEGEVDQTVFAQYRAKFEDALCNDMNTSMAITVLYDVVKADTNDATKLALIADFDKFNLLHSSGNEYLFRSSTRSTLG